jgi:hypothetical protein
VQINSSKSVIVVASGCPEVLIQELLRGHILPFQKNVAVLLPPDGNKWYGNLIDQPNPFKWAQFLQSPGQRFFSVGHLYWLRANLRSAENAYLLVSKSPYQDIRIAFTSLSVLMLSRKPITLLFATPQAVIDLVGQGFSERWLVRELNLRVIVKEVGRLFRFLKPRSILYFSMFGGLIARKMLSEYLVALSKKYRFKRI